MWFLLIFAPLFTLRLYQDEMRYLEFTKEVLQLKFQSRSPLVLFINAPLMIFNNVDMWVFLPRAATAIVTLATLLLIYEICRESYGPRAGFLSSLVFLLSFVVLRHGARYSMEPWGTFFVLLAIYFFQRKPLLSAASMGLAFAARETWLTTYPFYLLYSFRNSRKDFPKILFVSSVPVILTFVYIYLVDLRKSPLVYNVGAVLYWGFEGILARDLRSWAEFVVAYPLIVFGFMYWVKHLKKESKSTPSRDTLLLILPSVVTLSGVNGFIMNGPFDRYTFGPLALMSLFSGYGIIKGLRELKSKLSELGVERIVATILVLQFVIFNVGVLYLSDIGAKGIQDYGYWYDRKVFEILLENADENDFLAGTPHPYLLGYKNWIWANRFLDDVIKLNPDWLITYRSWVEIKCLKDIRVYTSGPYVVIESLSGNLSSCVEAKELVFWKWRK